MQEVTSKTHHRITYEDRQQIESMLADGFTKVEIARLIELSRTALYKEINRGSVNGKYNADVAQKRVFST